MKPFDLMGLWWLPRDPSKRVAGRLTFDGDSSISLALVESFKELKDTPSLVAAFNEMMSPGNSQEESIILGTTLDSKRFTLLNCFETNSSFSGLMTSDAVLSQKFYVRMAIEGTHFASPQEILVDTIDMELTHLPEWASRTGIVTNFSESIYTIRYERPELLIATVPGGALSLAHGWSTSGARFRSANVAENVGFRIDLDQPAHIDAIFGRYIQPIQHLLTLATIRPNSVETLIVYSNEIATEITDGKRHRQALEIYYQQVYTDSGSGKRLLPPDMLFGLSDVGMSAIEKWFDVASELESVCNLFFSIRYMAFSYVEQRFMSVVQSLESYHRRRYRNTVDPDATYRRNVEIVLQSIPESLRTWVSSRLEYGNEPGLRKRLRDLLTSVEDVIAPVAGRQRGFINKVVDNRNYLTHYDPTSKAKKLDGETLHEVTQILVFVMEACLMHEIGIQPDKLKELFDRNQRYAQTVMRYRQNRRKKRI